MSEYVERDAVLDALEDTDASEVLKKVVMAIPAADVVPAKNAKWIPVMVGDGNWNPIQEQTEWYGNLYVCDRCGMEMIGDRNYCPNCGSMMRERERTT